MSEKSTVQSETSRFHPIFAVALFVATCSPTFGSILLTGQLTGDPRPDNPDHLIIDYSIAVNDATPDIASWIIDINSPLHPNIKLDAFFFNLALPVGTTVTAQNVSPSNSPGKQWTLTAGNNAPGTGSADFEFSESLSGGGSSAPNEVNNSMDLTFELKLSSGTWLTSYFTAAETSTGNAVLGPMQLGAHLQSLVASSGESDSGVARGMYPTPTVVIRPTELASMPEPASLIAWSLLSIAGAGIYGRKRRKTIS